MNYLLIIWIFLILELCFKPRLDITKDKKILLWYGRSLKRKYFVLFEP